MLINERNAAYRPKRGDEISYRRLWNQVNRLRITLPNKYYNKYIEILKSSAVSCKKIQDAGFNFQFKTIETALENVVKK